MKIKDIIIEDDEYDKLAQTVAQDIAWSHQNKINIMKTSLLELSAFAKRTAQPYLTQIGGIENALFNYPLYRGVAGDDYHSMDIPNDHPFNTVAIRKDRNPKDTPKNVSAAIDDWFEEKTNIRIRRQSLFCFGREAKASAYGITVAVIPTGNFSYCWSKEYGDMYESMERFVDAMGDGDEYSTPYSLKEKMKQVFDDYNYLDDFMTAGDYQFNKGLVEGIRSGREMMLIADKAIVVNSFWLDLAKYHYQNENWTI